MRAGIGLACLTLFATSAGGEPKLQPKRPNANAKYSPKALEFFFEGLANQLQGELHFALNAYSSSRSDDNQEPETFFNVGLITLELERTDEAARLFRDYLANSPKDVADRAQIQKLQKQLETAAPVVTIGGELKDSDAEADAIVLVDGRVVGASPATITTTEGAHEAERITATTYKQETFRARVGIRDYVGLRASTKDDGGGGNVVISGLSKDTWKDGDTKFATGKRFALAPGRYSTTATGVRAMTCAPIEFEVKSTKELTYVRVSGEVKKGTRCMTVTKVEVQRLKVGDK